MNSTLIDQFAGAGEKLRTAVAGLTDEQMLAFPVPGTWSIHQIVIHLMDSDGIGVDRMKRTAAESNPLLMGYQENAYLKELFPEAQSIEDAVTLFDLTRKQFAKVLRRLPETAWAKTAIHSERGKVTLQQQLEMYVWHFEHHLGFLVKKRQMLSGGK